MRNPNIILIKAVNSANKGTALIQPPKNEYGGHYGVEHLPEDELRKIPAGLRVTEHSEFELKHNLEINLNDPVQAVHWKWIKHHPILAMSAEEAMNNRRKQFYVDDEETLIAKNVRLMEQKLELGNWVRSMTAGERVELCSLLNYKADRSSPDRVMQFLLEAIDNKDLLASVIKAKQWMATGEAKKISLAKKFIERKYFVQKGKYFYFENAVIADSLDTVVFWMSQPQNTEVVRQMIARVKVEENKDLVFRVESPNGIDHDKFQLNKPVENRDMLADLIKEAEYTGPTAQEVEWQRQQDQRKQNQGYEEIGKFPGSVQIQPQQTQPIVQQPQVIAQPQGLTDDIEIGADGEVADSVQNSVQEQNLNQNTSQNVEALAKPKTVSAANQLAQGLENPVRTRGRRPGQVNAGTENK